MNSIPLRDVDLNLLVILDILLQEKSVSRSAQRLHLTPSAVSHALGRLRKLFDDELLIRDGRRMNPTVRGQELSTSLPRVLRHLADTLAGPKAFDFAHSNRTFRLVAPDFIAPLVLVEVARVAPGVRVEWNPNSSTTAQDLSQGHYDALLASSALHSDGLRKTEVGTWPWRVYGRGGHPAFEHWSLDAWSNYAHLQVGTSVMPGQGPIDKRVVDLNVTRRVTTVVPYFSMAAAVLAETDLLLSVPSVTLDSTAEKYLLESRDLPFDMPPMSLSVFRSATHGNESGVRWFLERIAAVCSEL